MTGLSTRVANAVALIQNKAMAPTLMIIDGGDN